MDISLLKDLSLSYRAKASKLEVQYHTELFEITFLACITELQVDSR